MGTRQHITGVIVVRNHLGELREQVLLGTTVSLGALALILIGADSSPSPALSRC